MVTDKLCNHGPTRRGAGPGQGHRKLTVQAEDLFARVPDPIRSRAPRSLVDFSLKLKQIVDLAYKGTVETSCRIVDPQLHEPIHSAFNEAWYQFWHHPRTYILWEKQKVNELRELCGIAVKETQ